MQFSLYTDCPTGVLGLFRRRPVTRPRRRTLLAAALWSTLAFAATDASAEVLVSNIGQNDTANVSFRAHSIAQGFTTASNSGGYTLSSIEVRFSGSAPHSDLVVRLATGLPGSTTTVATLDNPSTLTNGINTFTAPDNMTLSASTTYFVVVVGNSVHSSAANLAQTNSSNEDPGGKTGFSVGNSGHFRSVGQTGTWSNLNNSLLIRVNGTENASTAPVITIAGDTSPVTEGTAAEFTVTADSAPSANLTVNLTVSDASGSDFVASGDEGSKTVTISADSTSATYSVDTVADTTDEPNGSVTVTVASGTGYTVGSTASASVTVNDDDDPPNNAPVFTGQAATASVDENSADGTAVVTITATDADAGDSISYSLDTTSDKLFDIGSSGAITVNVDSGSALDHEATSSITATVTATDSHNATATHDVTISVADVDEPPDAPAAPSVSGASSTSVTVSWTAPANTGKPAINDYDVQFKLSSATSWTSHTHTGTGTSTTISSLTPGATYDAQVKAKNDEGESGWSATGSGATDVLTITIAADTSPVTEGTAAQFTVTASTAPSANLTVNLTVSDASGSDFVASGDEGSKTVTISADSTSATYSVDTVADTTDEPNGSVTVTVASGTGYTVGSTASASVTVNDDDFAVSMAFTNLPTVSTWGIGGVIELTATFPQAVTVNTTGGTPRIALNPAMGYPIPFVAGMTPQERYASYVSGSGTRNLVFRYTVVEGDISSPSVGSPLSTVSVRENALDLNGGTIRTGTVDASLAHNNADSGKRVHAYRNKISNAAIHPASVPTVDADLNGVPETYTTATGNNMVKVGVQYSRTWRQSGEYVVNTQGSNTNVQIVVDIGGTDVTLDFIALRLGVLLEFGTHTVVAANNDSDGITIKRDNSDNVIRLSNGATIKSVDAGGGNDVDLPHGVR